MKVLLDENLPHALRHDLRDHDVLRFNKWAGAALRTAHSLRKLPPIDSDVLVTMDNGVAYQQNLRTLLLSLIVIASPSNDIDDLLPLLPKLREAMQHLKPRTIARIG